MTSRIDDRKDCWLVVSNSDLTEGRGRSVILYVCESEATAARLAEKKGVQGSNAEVRKSTGFRCDGTWCYPSEIEKPTNEDRARDDTWKEIRALRKKAIDAGISKDDLQTLGNCSHVAW